MLRGLRSVLGVYKTHRLSAALVARLKPLVEAGRDAQGLMDEQAWLTSFRLGFLGTVVDRLGHGLEPTLESEAAAQLQIDVWSSLIGLPGDLVGERLLALSLAQDKDFLRGCEAGLAFADAAASELHGRRDEGALGALDLWRYHLASEE